MVLMVYLRPVTAPMIKPEPHGILMKIERSALVAHTALDMYRLVQDVPSYPDFLRWCTRAEIHEQGPGHQLASLSVKVAGLEQRFMTHNELRPGKSLDMRLVEGPFQSLFGRWQFRQLGSAGSSVSLALEFEFKRGLISSTFQSGFKRIADHMVQEFCRRADGLFSPGAN